MRRDRADLAPLWPLSVPCSGWQRARCPHGRFRASRSGLAATNMTRPGGRNGGSRLPPRLARSESLSDRQDLDGVVRNLRFQASALDVVEHLSQHLLGMTAFIAHT